MRRPAIQRSAHWLYLRFGGRALLRLVPLCMAMIFIGAGLAAIVKSLSINGLYATACLGVLIGWLLARTRLPGWGSGLATTGLGFTWMSLTVGQIGLYLFGLLSAFFSVGGQFIHRTTPDFSLVVKGWDSLLQALVTLSSRFSNWFNGVIAGKSATDPIVNGLLWGLALWLVAAWAAWWVRRRNTVTVGMLPALTLLAYNIFYTNSVKGIVWLGLAGGSWLVLQAAHNFMTSRQQWQERRLDQAEIELQMAIAVSVSVIGLVLASILLPAFSVKKLSDAIQRIYQTAPDKSLAESLGLQQTPITSGAGAAGAIGQSPIHQIGPGPHLSQDITLMVSVDGYESPPPSIVEDFVTLPEPAPRYWRAQTYEQYNGSGWTTQAGNLEDYAVGSPLEPDLAASPGGYRIVTQHVERVYQSDKTLFVTGELLQADQPLTALWRSPGDLIGAQTQANSYTAESRLPTTSEQGLRQAGSDYPDSIRSRYLSLPAELPQRVRDLTLRLTANKLTTYDKAVALQDYLRQFPYTLDVPAPPTGRDVADFFLFDLQKGYCDYYATTMVVMARAAGIPARLVIGYVSSEYNYNIRRFVIRQVNAHAWVEIYFPGTGWVEFEPTASQPRPVRAGEKAQQNAVVPPIPTPVARSATGNGQFDWTHFRRLLLVLEIILVTLLALLLLPLESWLLHLRPADQAIMTIYRRLYRQGHVLGVGTGLARTPHEFAAALASRMETLSKYKRRSPLPALLPDLDWLTSLYVRLLYGPYLPTRAESLRAIRAWSRLRRSLRRMGKLSS